jgi:hypothetical protein
MSRTALLLALIPGLLDAGAVGAQVPDLRGRGELLGIVVDNGSDEPIAGVRVEIIDDARRLLHTVDTDENGFFRVTRIRPGPFMLRVVRLGYRANSTPLWSIAGNQVLQVEVRLDAEAIVLAPLTVTSSRRMVRPSPVLEGFRARAAVGIGHFITRADIERRQPGRITDILANVPGVHLDGGGIGNRRVVYLNRGPQGRCPAQVYVDGMLLNRMIMRNRDAGFAIDDAVNPASVEGIEVYRGTAGIPAEFLTPEAQCGVVVIWTRRGDRAGAD